MGGQNQPLPENLSIQDDLNILLFFFTLHSSCVLLGLATIAQQQWLLSALSETVVGVAERSTITVASWK